MGPATQRGRTFDPAGLLSWIENGEIVSTESTLTFLATEERELEAHFARAGVTLPGAMRLLLEE